jgi:hypothetical protein
MGNALFRLCLCASVAIPLWAQEGTIDRASRAAESFWEQFPAVQCRERVTQTKLKADGSVTTTHAEEFDYVAFLKSTNRGLAVDESRVAHNRRVGEDNERLLITSGFPTLLLMFHPDFRNRFEFTELSPSQIDFKSKRDTPSMSALKLKDHVYPILWKGTVTLDAVSGSIRRIDATLAAPMDDLGLSALQVEVDYASTMLPVRATISLKTPRQAWRNVHEFSDYKRFAVTTSTRETQEK